MSKKKDKVDPWSTVNLDEMANASLTPEMLQDAMNQALSNFGTPDTFMMPASTAHAAGLINDDELREFFRSAKYNKIKERMPLFPSRVSDEQVEEMKSAQFKLAEILYGQGKKAK